jgi:predicted nicotinamide N-methyase
MLFYPSNRRANNMFSLKTFHKKYDTEPSNLTIGGRNFRFFVPRSLDGFVDIDDIFHEFPLWAKIWDASIILADCLAGMPVDKNRNFLEIGCGIGVAGIVAASFGHKGTLTEYNDDALNFVRANARENRTPEGPFPEIRRLDWNNPEIDEPFDIIVGSEVVFKEEDYEPLSRLFKRCLKPSGEIILAERARETSIGFFRQMSEPFAIRAKKMVLRSEEGGEVRVILARMKRK